jgi:hypothetical protein
LVEKVDQFGDVGRYDCIELTFACVDDDDDDNISVAASTVTRRRNELFFDDET